MCFNQEKIDETMYSEKQIILEGNETFSHQQGLLK